MPEEYLKKFGDVSSPTVPECLDSDFIRVLYGNDAVPCRFGDIQV